MIYLYELLNSICMTNRSEDVLNQNILDNLLSADEYENTLYLSKLKTDNVGLRESICNLMTWETSHNIPADLKASFIENENRELTDCVERLI
jgi:hypothetical protein